MESGEKNKKEKKESIIYWGWMAYQTLSATKTGEEKKREKKAGSETKQ